MEFNSKKLILAAKAAFFMYKWIKRNNMVDFYCYTANFSVFFFKHYAADSSSDLQHMCCVFKRSRTYLYKLLLTLQYI